MWEYQKQGAPSAGLRCRPLRAKDKVGGKIERVQAGIKLLEKPMLALPAFSLPASLRICRSSYAGLRCRPLQVKGKVFAKIYRSFVILS